MIVRYPGRPGRSRILIARGALDHLGRAAARGELTRVVVISDRRVAGLYARRALASLRRSGIAAELLVVPGGERAKRPAELIRIWSRLAALQVTRRDALVALGGGSIGDLTGFAAATWLRGVPWIAVPTTLLAQVDSSIGGKTGIDLASGKNLVGAFHQPPLVIADPRVLGTLTPRQRRSGLAEVVKMGFATDAALFRWCERNAERLVAGDPSGLERAVRLSVAAKARVVSRDEREAGPRTALNFGHTLGHAIETALGYRRLEHGEAVAIGMRASAGLSVAAAGLAERDRARLTALLDRLGLPRRMPPLRFARLDEAMRLDKKRAAAVRWVLVPRIGTAAPPRPLARRLVRAALRDAGAS